MRVDHLTESTERADHRAARKLGSPRDRACLTTTSKRESDRLSKASTSSEERRRGEQVGTVGTKRRTERRASASGTTHLCQTSASVTHEARRGEVLGAGNLKRNERKKQNKPRRPSVRRVGWPALLQGDTDSNAAHAARSLQWDSTGISLASRTTRP